MYWVIGVVSLFFGGLLLGAFQDWRSRRPVPDGPPALVPWWARVLLGLTAVWAGLWIWFWSAGTVLDATVLRNDDGYCRVEWADPHGGKLQRANDVDCSSELRAGDKVEVLALPGVFRGEAGSSGESFWFPVVIGAVPLVIVGLAVGRRWRRRRAPVEPLAPWQVPIPERSDLPRISDCDVRWSRVLEVVDARAEAEGWEPLDPPPPPTEAGRRWWQDRSLRRIALATGVPRALPLGAVIIGVIAGLGPWLSAAELAAGDSAVVPGRVVRVTDDPYRLPWTGYDTRVEFTLDARTHRAWVQAKGKAHTDDPVQVLVATADPGRARLEGPRDALGQDAAVGGILAGLGLLGIGRRAFGARRVVRSLAAVRAEPGRPWRYVMFLGPDGCPGLMLFSRLGDPTPEVLVPMNEMAGWRAFPLHGETSVHGQVADGRPVVVVIDGHTWWPLGEAQVVPAEFVAAILNDEFDDDLDDDPADPVRA